MPNDPNAESHNETTETNNTETAPTNPLETAEFNQKLNAAISGHVKRALSGMEKQLAELAQSKAEPVHDGTKPNTATDDDPRIAKLERKLKEFEKREREAVAQARDERLTNQLTTKMRGKVADSWLDVAVEQVKRNVKFNESDAEIVIDDLPYSIDDGVKAWLGKDDNKRFLPAPKAPPAQQRQPVSVVQSADLSKLDPGSPEYIEAAAQAVSGEFAAEGTSLREFFNKR